MRLVRQQWDFILEPSDGSQVKTNIKNISSFINSLYRSATEEAIGQLTVFSHSKTQKCYVCLAGAPLNNEIWGLQNDVNTYQ